MLKIQHMVAFIEQEAKEKVQEIMVKVGRCRIGGLVVRKVAAEPRLPVVMGLQKKI